MAAICTVAFNVDAAVGSARAKPIPGKLLVQFRSDTSDERQGKVHRSVSDALTREPDHVRMLRGPLPVAVMRVPAGEESAAIKQYKADPAVVAVERDYIVTDGIAHDGCDSTSASCRVLNDPGIRKQWALQNDAYTVFGTGLNAPSSVKHDADLDVFRAWTKGLGPSLRIGIVDTGIDMSHPDLAPHIAIARDLSNPNDTVSDPMGHGTHVAGIASAVGNNGVGISGIAPETWIVAAKVFNKRKQSTNTLLYDGIQFASSQAVSVINMSLGNYPQSDIIQNLINAKWASGILFVASAGNEASTARNYPAAYDNVFSVANLQENDSLASTSNRGSWVDAAAPGTRIWSTVPTTSNDTGSTGYGYLSGTSMAAPAVAAVALLTFPTVDPGQPTPDRHARVVERLCATADPVSGTGTNFACGAINADQAVTNSPPRSLYPAAVHATSDLVSYWRLNETSSLAGARDEVGGHTAEYQHNGMTSGPAFAFGVPSVIGGGFDPAVGINAGSGGGFAMSGSIQYPPEGYPAAAGLQFGDQFSAEMWFKMSRRPEGYISGPLLGVEGARTGVTLPIPYPEEEYPAYVVLSGRAGTRLARSSAPITDTGWHYLVVSRNSADARIYLDGIDVTVPMVSEVMSGCVPACGFGRAMFPPGSHHTGTAFDDVALYRRALSASEVASHFNAARATGRG